MRSLLAPTWRTTTWQLTHDGRAHDHARAEEPRSSTRTVTLAGPLVGGRGRLVHG